MGQENDLGSVRNLIREIQRAIDQASDGWNTNLKIRTICLTLKTIATNERSLNLRVPLFELTPGVPTIDGGIKASDISTQEIYLELSQVRTKGSGEIATTFSEAVTVIKQVLEELKLSQQYGLNKATVTLDFLMLKSGEIKILGVNNLHKSEFSSKLVITIA